MKLNEELIHVLLDIFCKKEGESFGFTCNCTPRSTNSTRVNSFIQSEKKWANDKSKFEIINRISQLILKQSDSYEELLPAQNDPLKNKAYNDKRAEIQEVIDLIKAHCPSIGSVIQGESLIDKLEQNMESMVLVVRAEDLKNYGSNIKSKSYTLRSRELKDLEITIGDISARLSPNLSNAYLDQRSASSLGTGFFVRNNVIATAAHVLFPPFLNLKLEDLRFVKGFRVKSKATHGDEAKEFDTRIVISKKDVYKPVKTSLTFEEDYQLSSLGFDWALIEVEPEHPEGQLPEQGVVGLDETAHRNDNLYSLGFGMGLPLKVSYAGKVTENDPSLNHFECNLDFFSGNSGSPVFDAETHKVIGILVRGKREFVYDKSVDYFLPNIYSHAQRGEECQRIGPIKYVLQNKKTNEGLITRKTNGVLTKKR